MVGQLRRGRSLRAVARLYGVALSTVQRWRDRARQRRLDRTDWADRPVGCRRPTHCTPPAVEESVLAVRQELQRCSDPGEYGAAAIERALEERVAGNTLPRVPSLRTIGRILARRGAVDGRRRA